MGMKLYSTIAANIQRAILPLLEAEVLKPTSVNLHKFSIQSLLCPVLLGRVDG